MSSKILSKFKDRTLRQLKDRQKYEARINKSLYYVKYPEIDCLSLPLTELAAEIFSETHRGQSLDRLHYSDAVTISWHACVSPLALVMAVVYLDRLKKINPEYLQQVASSDLFLVSLMVSYKFMCDDGDADEVFMDDWASSARISVKELVQLERDFLKAIDWNVFIQEPAFWEKLSEIELALAKQQGLTRGYFTYTELEKLLRVTKFTRIYFDSFLALLSCIAVYFSTLTIIMATVLTLNAISTSSMLSLPELNTQLEEIPLNNIPRHEEIALLNNSDCLLNTNKNLLHICNNTKIKNSYVERTDYASTDNIQIVSWDWWTIPTLNWLIETSQLMNSFETSVVNLETSFIVHKANVQEIEMEEIMQKGTKTRIQDQIENSWHKEWTDTIFKELMRHKNVIHLEL